MNPSAILSEAGTNPATRRLLQRSATPRVFAQAKDKWHEKDRGDHQALQRRLCRKSDFKALRSRKPRGSGARRDTWNCIAALNTSSIFCRR
jgi:hypothetical protein